MNKLRNVDASDRALVIKAATWSMAGAIIGTAAGAKIGGVLGAIIGCPLGFAIVFFFTLSLVKGAAITASTIYAPSGNSTPPKREYSHPQALVAHGHYEEAVQAYQVFCTEFPEDPEPYLRIARLYRTELQRYNEALSWFKKARTQAKMTQALELLVTQEIVEVYTHKLGTPQRAMPELARLVDRFPGTEAAAWARQRLGELRAALVQDHEAQARNDRTEPL
ncbi:MAG: hypothetical protein HY700_09765 [Gemmatimonadetes bacterium]|nr:hypothetical protein [Gemmatimonadota bacterium]